MHEELSKARLNIMRGFYLFNALVIGYGAWPEIISPAKPWDMIHSVAFSLYAGYSVLLLLGVLLPTTMLPLLLLQIVYKLIWLTVVALPKWSAGQLNLVSDNITFFVIIVVMDLIVIPWPYVFKNYVKAGFQQKGSNVRNLVAR